MRRGGGFLVLALAFGAAVPAFADFNVSGRFLYVDREFDATGFTGAEPQRAVRFADVQVIDGSKIIGAGTTDASGSFLFRVTDTRTRDLYVRCVARRQTTLTAPVEVRSGNQSGDLWAIRSQSFLGHSPNQDLFIGSLVAVPGSGGEAFNLLDVATLGGDYLQAVRGSGSAPLLLVIFNAANPNLSSFSPTSNTITQANNAGYDDTVLLHEMGHYIINNFSREDSPGGTHHLSDCNQNLMLAFDEGHSTAWGCGVRRYFNLPNSSSYVRTTGLPGPGNLQFSFDTETQIPFICRGATSEMTVLAALWDLFDGPATTDGTPGTDEAWDLLQGQDAAYWKVMTTYLPGAVNISLEDFWDGWFQPTVNGSHLPEMVSIFRELGVEYFTDSFEPNDKVAEAREIFPGPTLLHQTFFADRDLNLLGEPDADFFTFSVVAGLSYTIETLNLLSDANTTLDLLAADGTTLLASNNDRSASDSSSLISYIPSQTGRLYLKSTHAADYGIYGSYDLRVATSSGGLDNDHDGYASEIDCNDNDPSIYPGAVEICNRVDDNCNGVIDEGFDRDLDGFTSCGGDCNDANAQIHPGAVETCDGVDQNCNGTVDEGFDVDGDGYTSCGGDCNDANAQIHPGAVELCNGVDDNCNQLVDEDFDLDADGYTVCGGDCNDSNALVHPNAPEACDGLDNDCDLLVDEGFPDTDGDGLADCIDPDDDNDGVPDALDCAPLAYSMTRPPVEVADTFLVPSGSSTRLSWSPIPETNVYNIYRGEVQSQTGWNFQTVCQMAESATLFLFDNATPSVGTFFYYLQTGANLCGEGTVGTGSNGSPRPLAAPCASQGRDSDLDLVIDLVDNCPLTSNPTQADTDRDGRGDACDNCVTVSNPTQKDLDRNGLGDACQDGDRDGFTFDVDCNDGDASVHPGAVDNCNNRDDDCDGIADEGFAKGGACTAGTGACQRSGTMVCSADGLTTVCSAVPGTPGIEVCNFVDDDCDGLVDEGFDQDNDGYTSCGGDCADTVAAVHPGALEVFNGVDDDCNNIIDDVIEILTISRATWQASNGKLTVEATTNYPLGSVTLTVAGYGAMTYVPTAGVYRLTATLPANPGSVTVTSTGGGRSTSPVGSI
ncbi:MAG TPA: putative metal-binding motif-containing protein [Candidatus Polarisedimenticolia bacterium]|nr:putative metal-binding motif-containing protein [Candidatus Polarisedimenticolia bacterium]